MTAARHPRPPKWRAVVDDAARPRRRSCTGRLPCGRWLAVVGGRRAAVGRGARCAGRRTRGLGLLCHVLAPRGARVVWVWMPCHHVEWPMPVSVWAFVWLHPQPSRRSGPPAVHCTHGSKTPYLYKTNSSSQHKGGNMPLALQSLLSARLQVPPGKHAGQGWVRRWEVRVHHRARIKRPWTSC